MAGIKKTYTPELSKEKDQMAEILRLRKELAEAKKENEFLKKAAAFFAKELDWNIQIY